jgi:hypothetical protein
MGTAINGSSGFDAMTNDAAFTVSALGGEQVNGAFEAIKDVSLPSLVMVTALSYSFPQVLHFAII